MFDKAWEIPEQLTKLWVLSKISEEEVFSYYIPNEDITKVFSSPFRSDNSPSFGIFQSKNGVLLYKDLATGERGDCFILVKRLYNLPTVYKAVEKVATDFQLLPGKYSSPIIRNPNVPKITEKEPSLIRVTYRKWEQHDIQFWEKYGASPELCEYFDIKPIKGYYLNDYYFTAEKHSYAYHFGDYKYKIYSPYSEYKWFSNIDTSILQGYSKIDTKGEVLVITKALKDVVTLFTLGINSVAPAAESVLITPLQYKILSQRYSKIYSLMDYDNAGIHLAWLMREKYNIDPIFLTEKVWSRGVGYRGCKDISDYRSMYGQTSTQKLINTII